MKKVVLSINALKAMNFLLETVLAPQHLTILVEDAMKGMHVLRNRPIVDVIIVDLDYDTYENLEFINHIKTSRLYSGCKVVILSTIGDSLLVDYGINSVDGIFSKPFSPEKLITYIDKLLKQNTTLTV